MATTGIDGLRQIWEKSIDLAKMADNFASGQTWNIGPNAKITGLADPDDDTGAATKGYVDSVAQGLDPKESVRAASTATVDIANAPAAIGGVTLNSTDRVLLKNQDDAEDNGIYIFNGAGSAMTRSLDADEDSEVTAGLYVFVEEGTNADTGWVLTTDNPIDLGVDELVFSKFSAAAAITAGEGLVQNGQAFDVNVGKGLAINSDFVDVVVDETSIDILSGSTNALEIKALGVTAAKLGADVAGSGLEGGNGSALTVNVDDSTIEVGLGGLQVKAGGITSTEIADNAVGSSEIAAGAVLSGHIGNGQVNPNALDASVAGDGIGGGAGTALFVDFVREKFLTPFTGGNQVAIANSPVDGSVMVFLNGLLQEVGATEDYQIAGQTITFNANLKNKDVVTVWYLK